MDRASTEAHPKTHHCCPWLGVPEVPVVSSISQRWRSCAVRMIKIRTSKCQNLTNLEHTERDFKIKMFK